LRACRELLSRGAVFTRGEVERGKSGIRKGNLIARNPSWGHASMMGYVRHTPVCLGRPERTPPILRR